MAESRGGWSDNDNAYFADVLDEKADKFFPILSASISLHCSASSVAQLKECLTIDDIEMKDLLDTYGGATCIVRWNPKKPKKLEWGTSTHIVFGVTFRQTVFQLLCVKHWLGKYGTLPQLPTEVWLMIIKFLSPRYITDVFHLRWFRDEQRLDIKRIKDEHSMDVFKIGPSLVELKDILIKYNPMVICDDGRSPALLSQQLGAAESGQQEQSDSMDADMAAHAHVETAPVAISSMESFLEALRQRGANDEFLRRISSFEYPGHVSFEHMIDIVVKGFCGYLDEGEQYQPTLETLRNAGLTDAGAQDLWECVFTLPPLYPTKVEVWISLYLSSVLDPLLQHSPYPFEQSDTASGVCFSRSVRVSDESMSLQLMWVTTDEASGLSSPDFCGLLDLPPHDDEYVYLFHGTDDLGMRSIISDGVQRRSRPFLDFNSSQLAYYATKSGEQAWRWAQRIRWPYGRGKAVIVHRVKKSNLYAGEYILFDVHDEPRDGRFVRCLRSFQPASYPIANDWAALVRHCRRERRVDALDQIHFVEGPYCSQPPNARCACPLRSPCAECSVPAVGHQLCVLTNSLADMFTQSLVGVFFVL